jgi:histone-lysine N-methyltransferase SETMAR
MVRTELKIQEVTTLVYANRSRTVDEIAAAAGISYGACHKILSDDLSTSHVTQHSVPRILTQDQCDDHMSICSDLTDSADKDRTPLSQIITGDKTWRFRYSPQPKREWATWKSPSLPRKKKSRQDRPKGKVMLELFFNSLGIVHMEFIQEGATVNKHRYKEILRHLCNSICRKHPELWRRKNWLLLHGNAPAHCYVLDQEELAKQHVTVLPHPPYSPDLAPCDFFDFPA